MKLMSLLFVIAFFAGDIFAQAPDVSRKPPKEYEEHLKPLLSTWQSLADRAAKFHREDADAIVEFWAEEELIWIDKNASKVITVLHDAQKALKSEGVKLIGETQRRYGAKNERLHLVLARSTRDGKVFKDVAPEGILIKRPEQPDTGSAMHTDDELLTLIYPDVAEGTITESVIVREEHVRDIPGHFMRAAPWGSLAAVHLRRMVVDLPMEMEKELRWKPVGMVLADPLRTKLPGGRVRLEWHSEGLPKVHFEERGPSMLQTGPVLRMSTLPDWESLGRWFAGELRECGDVSAEQAAEAGRMLKGAKNEREKAARLFDHVSRDVRYTALEFGRGRYQPRHPKQVAETLYGDCKDKANLLRVLLAKQGIESRLALLDTRHAGIIDRSVPSPGRFTHAILAVTLPGVETPIFCDPTLGGVPFGTLAVGDTDRDALVIHVDGRTEWLRTPKQVFVRHTAEVDLIPEPGGGLSGWVRVDMDGAYGHQTQRQWEKMAAEGRRNIAKGTVSGLQGHEVIDFTDEPSSASGKKVTPFQLTSYVLKPGAAITQAEATERLSFPMLGALLVGTGTQAQRQTPITCTLMEMRVRGGYQVPKGWKVLDVPAAFHREAAGCIMDAAWMQKGTKLFCECTVTTTQTLIQAAEHASLWQARRDFAEWLSQPALVKRPAIPHPDKEAEEPDEPRLWLPAVSALPKMPSAQGQVLLIDKRYPIDPKNPFEGEHDLRRVAARQLLKLFPHDRLAKFEGELRLIMSDMMEDVTIEGLEKRIKPLLDDPDGNLTPQQMAQGRLMLAGILLDDGKVAEARALALANYENERIPLLLRQLAAAIAAISYQKENPQRAVELGRVGLSTKMLPSITLYPLGTAFFSSLAQLPEITPPLIHQECRQVIGAHASDAELLRDVLLDLPDELIAQGHLDAADKLTTALELCLADEGWDPESKSSLESNRETIADARAFAPVQKKLLAWLKEHPWPDADRIEEGDVIEDASDSSNAAEDIYDKPHVRSRYLLRSLTHYGPNPEGFSIMRDVVECAQDWYCDKEAPQPPPPETEALIDEMLHLIASTGDEDKIWGCDLLRGAVIKRRSGAEAALKHFNELLSRADKDADRCIEVHRNIAEIHQEAKDYPKVLAEWEKLREWPDEPLAWAFSEDAAQLALRLGDRAAAWRNFRWFTERKSDDSFLSSLHGEGQAHVKKMCADPASTEAWWDRADRWWPEWEKLSQKGELAPPYPDEPTNTLELETKSIAQHANKSLENQDRKSLVHQMHYILRSARIYPHIGPEAAKLLRIQAAKAFPKYRAEFQKLASRLDQ